MALAELGDLFCLSYTISGKGFIKQIKSIRIQVAIYFAK